MPEEYVKRKSMFEHMLNIVIVLITLFTILVICRAFLCDLMIVDGNSMTPTYTDCQMVFVNKIKYQITSPGTVTSFISTINSSPPMRPTIPRPPTDNFNESPNALITSSPK